MKKLSTYLLVIFMIMYWGFRVIITLMAQLGKDVLGVVPINMTFEMVLLFVFLLCAILVVKRKIVGALIYLLSYGMYFGVDLYNNIQTILMPQESGILPEISIYTNTIISLIGIIIPIAVLIDLLADKNRKNNPKDSKTDWFYKNEQYDRKLDERADKNNYRTL